MDVARDHDADGQADRVTLAADMVVPQHDPENHSADASSSSVFRVITAMIFKRQGESRSADEAHRLDLLAEIAAQNAKACFAHFSDKPGR